MQTDGVKYEKSDSASYGAGLRCSYASSCVLPELEPEYMPRKHSLQSEDKQSDPTNGEMELSRFTDNLAKHIDAAFHIESNEVELSLSAIQFAPKQYSRENDGLPETEHIEAKLDSPSKRRSLRERVRSFASNSKVSLGSDRVSWQSFSSGHAELSRSMRSNSVTTFTGSVGNASTKSSPKAKRGKSGEKKRPSVAPPSPSRIVKYVAPSQDYMFVDLDYFTHPRPMSQVKSPEVSPKVKKPVKTRNLEEQDTSAFRELVDYIRVVTGIEVRAQSLGDFRAPETMQDIKSRSAMHLRCTTCRGDCPVCGVACCIYENARGAAALAHPSLERARKLKVVLHTIESLGPGVQSVDTFSLCSERYGCGRYVCSNCAGVCPNGICHDVQCKACKPDPWCPCDWYSID